MTYTRITQTTGLKLELHHLCVRLARLHEQGEYASRGIILSWVEPMETKAWPDRITSAPRVLAGQCRYSQYSPQRYLYPALLASGMTVEDILQEYEGLTPQDIRAYRLFAAKMLENISFVSPGTEIG